MIISEKIHMAKEKYKCDNCSEYIYPGEFYFRLFGMGCFGDPPYEIMLHLGCRGYK
jgi:hypothetical protein